MQKLYKKKSLNVNIDHVVSIRELRKTPYPSLEKTIEVLESKDIHGITFHLREDRRHIQDHDVFMIKKKTKLPINFEASSDKDILKIILQIRPQQVTLVPENRMELTTEGGLNLLQIPKSFLQAIEILNKEEIPISLFIDPKLEQVKEVKNLGIKIIELNTGEYSEAQTLDAQKVCLFNLQEAASYAFSLNLKIHAGHGLYNNNIENILKIPEVEELNIGHGIIARALFVGLDKAIDELQQKIIKYNSLALGK